MKTSEQIFPSELAKSTSRKLYENDFHDHLISLILIDLTVNGVFQDEAQTDYNLSRYLGLQQTALENAYLIENNKPNEINWSFVDLETEKFEEKIHSLLESSESLPPLKKATVDSFENFLIYDQMFPSSELNPWKHTQNIIKNGFLFYASDDKTELKEFGLTDEKYQQNLGFVIKGKPKNLGGFILDNRYKQQMLVHKFLFENAQGKNYPKNLDKIKSFLNENDFNLTKEEIQTKITTPLKRTGTIGSSVEGFFAIFTEEDLDESEKFHRSKADSINKIIKIYSLERAKKFQKILV